MTSSLTAPLRALILGLGLLAIAAPTHAKPSYLHASAGNIDIVSSMSEERTTRFLHELVGVRLTIEDLLGTPVLQAATQVIVFGSRREMDEFFPEINGYSVTYNVTWHCSTSPMGDTFSVINHWPNDKRHRQEALRAYASWLISRALPNCPYWIHRGLAEFLCTLEYRDGIMHFGESIIARDDRKPAKRIPLDETLGKAWGSRDTWGLWRMWLTTDYDGNRTRIRELARLIREGAPGDATTVSQVFGPSIREIQTDLYRHMRSVTEITIDRPALTAGLLDSLTFNEATPFEISVAKAIVLAALPKRPPGIESRLYPQLLAEPDSPRASEAKARLATADNDPTLADAHWKEAAARGSRNSYSYLVALSGALEGRTAQINLQPSLTPARATELRDLADRGNAINPGQLDILHWLAWIEAIAPDPQADRLDRVEASHVRYLRPATFLPLAVANLRLERFDRTARLLDEYERLFGANSPNQAVVDFLRKRIPAT